MSKTKSPQRMHLEAKIYSWAKEEIGTIHEFLSSKTDKLSVVVKLQSAKSSPKTIYSFCHSKSNNNRVAEISYLQSVLVRYAIDWTNEIENYPVEISFFIRPDRLSGQINLDFSHIAY